MPASPSRALPLGQDRDETVCPPGAPMLSLWGLDGDRATDGGGRPDMTTRGVDAVLAHLAKLPPQESLTLAEQRAQYERAERAFPVPADVTVERVTAPVAPAEWLAPPSARADIVVLYLHGGGYVIGSPRSHRHLAAAIARAARARALVLDYRLAPEHPFPAALEDAVGLAECLRVAGVAARLEIVPRMVHVWHWFLPMLDEAQTAVDEIGAFVNAHVG